MIDPNLVKKGIIVRLRTELAYGGEFIAIAEVTSSKDPQACPDNPHPVFKLLESVGHYNQGCKFWGTFSDILEIIND